MSVPTQKQARPLETQILKQINATIADDDTTQGNRTTTQKHMYTILVTIT